MRQGAFTAILLFACFAGQASGENIYFLVAEASTPYHGDSYVLPLTEPNDIAHARDLIEFGPSIGQAIVVARISCSPDCINGNYVMPDLHPWSWHVTQFEGFAGITAEILDGWPGLVESDCNWWVGNTGGLIGFWTYTVVSEFDAAPNLSKCDFDDDKDVDFVDFDSFGDRWRNIPCNSPDWCGGTDLDRNGAVDYNDLKILAMAWLIPFDEPTGPVWFDCWTNCRYQCYGDADCNKTSPPGSYRIYNNDLSIIMNVSKTTCGWPCYYPNVGYNPCADIDRDYNVYNDDYDIASANYEKRDSDFPVLCPSSP